MMDWSDHDLKREIGTLRRSRRRAVGIFAGLMLLAIAAMLTLWAREVGITGFQTMETFETFESDVFVSGASPENSLSFERVPNFIIRVGEEVSLQVSPNRADVVFSDDTNMFNITDYGLVEFTPSERHVGKHNVWIIIKDDEGHHYYQNVVIIVEDD